MRASREPETQLLLKFKTSVVAILDLGFVFDHVSVSNEDICVTFGLWVDIDHTKVIMTQNSVLEIQDDGDRHIVFEFFSYLGFSVANEDTFVRFGTYIYKGICVQGSLGP